MAYVDFDDRGDWVAGLDTIWGFDQYVFTAQSNDLKHNLKPKEIVGNTYGTDTSKKRAGIIDADLEIKGNYRGGHGQMRDVIRQRVGRKSPSYAWYSLDGVDPLAPVTFQPSHFGDNSRSSSVDDPAKVELSLWADGAFHDGFVLLSPHIILSGASGNGSVDDNILDGGDTTTGYAAMLCLLALEGGTNPTFTAKVEHSDDEGETWTPFLTLPAMNKPGGIYLKLPRVTTAHSLTRASWATTGTPTGVQPLFMGARGVDRRA